MNTARTPGSASAADGVDAVDRGAGEGAAHEAGVQHAGPGDVVDERAVAGEQPGVLDAGDPGARVAASRRSNPPELEVTRVTPVDRTAISDSDGSGERHYHALFVSSCRGGCARRPRSAGGRRRPSAAR